MLFMSITSEDYGLRRAAIICSMPRVSGVVKLRVFCLDVFGATYPVGHGTAIEVKPPQFFILHILRRA